MNTELTDEQREFLWYHLTSTYEWKELELLLADEVTPLRVTSFQWDVMDRVDSWLMNQAPAWDVSPEEWARLQDTLEDERKPVRAHAAFDDTLAKIEEWLQATLKGPGA